MHKKVNYSWFKSSNCFCNNSNRLDAKCRILFLKM